MIAGDDQNIKAETYDDDGRKIAASINTVSALGMRLDKLSSFRIHSIQREYGNDNLLRNKVKALHHEVRLLEGAMSTKTACSKLAEFVRENQNNDCLAISDVSGNQFKASPRKRGTTSCCGL